MTGSLPTGTKYLAEAAGVWVASVSQPHHFARVCITGHIQVMLQGRVLGAFKVYQLSDFINPDLQKSQHKSVSAKCWQGQQHTDSPMLFTITGFLWPGLLLSLLCYRWQCNWFCWWLKPDLAQKVKGWITHDWDNVLIRLHCVLPLKYGDYFLTTIIIIPQGEISYIVPHFAPWKRLTFSLLQPVQC